MASEKLRGLAEANALFDSLPPDAEAQLAVEMAIIGRETLAAQRALVPVDTGELKGDLGLQLLLDQLKVRVGLLIGGRDAGKLNGRARRGRSGGPFYGRIVQFGRAAQTVIVTRKAGLKRLLGNNRKGNTRRGVYERKPYKMKVKAMAARNFVFVPGAAETAMGQLAEFWSRLLVRRGGV